MLLIESEVPRNFKFFFFLANNVLKFGKYLLCQSQVYDVTSYLDDHPGGDDVVLAATGNSFLAVSLYIIYLSWNFPAQVYHNPSMICDDVGSDYVMYYVFNSKSITFCINVIDVEPSICFDAFNFIIAAKDATDEFEDAGHSKDARELLESFCIGELDTSSPLIPELEISSKRQPSDFALKLKNLTKQYWAAPVAVVGISVMVGFLCLRKK